MYGEVRVKCKCRTQTNNAWLMITTYPANENLYQQFGIAVGLDVRLFAQRKGACTAGELQLTFAFTTARSKDTGSPTTQMLFAQPGGSLKCLNDKHSSAMIYLRQQAAVPRDLLLSSTSSKRVAQACQTVSPKHPHDVVLVLNPSWCITAGHSQVMRSLTQLHGMHGMQLRRCPP